MIAEPAADETSSSRKLRADECHDRVTRKATIQDKAKPAKVPKGAALRLLGLAGWR
jgi:hypothetical protein